MSSHFNDAIRIEAQNVRQRHFFCPIRCVFATVAQKAKVDIIATGVRSFCRPSGIHTLATCCPPAGNFLFQVKLPHHARTFHRLRGARVLGTPFLASLITGVYWSATCADEESTRALYALLETLSAQCPQVASQEAYRY